MISRDHFINKIGELKFSYKDTLKRTFLYRQAGTTNVIYVPRKKLVSEEYVTSQLRQLGCTAEEIVSFIASAKT